MSTKRREFTRPSPVGPTITIVCWMVLLTACSAPGNGGMADAAWIALEPNTSSHDRGAWDVVESRSVRGAEIRELFAGEPVPGECVSGPKPPENSEIEPESSYWYVVLEPHPATPVPIPSEVYSPTAPPNIPEPFLRAAHFLFEQETGQVVARKVYCVIY